MEAYDVQNVDGSVDGNFLSLVDVYRVYSNPAKQVDFWVTSCCAGGCASCQYTIQTGCLSVLNSRHGYVDLSAGNWNSETGVYDSVCVAGYSNRARMWYKAGLRSHRIDQAVSLLALTMLDRPICTCSSLEHITKWWATDLALRAAGSSRSESYQLSGTGRRGQLDNPFGTTRAALQAWRIVNDARILD